MKLNFIILLISIPALVFCQSETIQFKVDFKDRNKPSISISKKGGFETGIDFLLESIAPPLSFTIQKNEESLQTGQLTSKSSSIKWNPPVQNYLKENDKLKIKLTTKSNESYTVLTGIKKPEPTINKDQTSSPPEKEENSSSLEGVSISPKLDPKILNTSISSDDSTYKGLDKIEVSYCGIKKGNTIKIPKGKNTEGILIVVTDFNTIGYNLNISQEFKSYPTEVPDLLSVFTSNISFTNSSLKDIDANKVKYIEHAASIIGLSKQIDTFIENMKEENECYPEEIFKAKITELKKEITNKYGEDLNKLHKDYLSSESITTSEYDAFFKSHSKSKKSFSQFVLETQSKIDKLLNTKFRVHYPILNIEDNDFIELTLTQSPNKKDVKDSEKISQTISFPLKGGFKVDGGLGIFYSSTGSNKYNLVQKNENGELVNKILEDTINPHFGAMAMIHLYKRMGAITPTGSIGVGLNTQRDISILIGAGVLFGKKDRFTLSAGLSNTWVKEPSQIYFDEDVELPSNATENLQTIRKWKPGYFVSVSFSFLGKRDDDKLILFPTESTGDENNSESSDTENSSESSSGETEGDTSNTDAQSKLINNLQIFTGKVKGIK